MIGKVGGGMTPWAETLEAPIAHRRREIAAVCVGVLAGWTGLVAIGVSMLG